MSEDDNVTMIYCQSEDHFLSNSINGFVHKMSKLKLTNRSNPQDINSLL